MVVGWRCKICGAVHNSDSALSAVLASAFTPVNVEEPKEEPKREERAEPEPRRGFLGRPRREEDVRRPNSDRRGEEEEDLRI